MSKYPGEIDFVNFAHEYKGDITELAAYFGVTTQTIHNWIKKNNHQDAILTARHSTDIRARGVIRRRIYEDDHLGAAMYWLDRSDKLREGAQEVKARDNKHYDRILEVTSRGDDGSNGSNDTSGSNGSDSDGAADRE